MFDVFSVNFQRMIPKAGFFKSSEVFKQLNEEAIKTKADRDKDVKKWTTFLQKPNRPIPIPRSEMDRVQSEPYRVRIVKQPKPRCDPNRVASPEKVRQEVESKPVIAEPLVGEVVPSNEALPAPCEDNQSAGDLEDTEVPDLEPCEPHEIMTLRAAAEEQLQAAAERNEALPENDQPEAENVEQAIEKVEEQEALPPAKPKSPEDEILEKRLAEVQNQLAALSSLPSTIQATLEAVSRQLAELMPAFKIRTSIDISGCMNDDSSLKMTEEIDIEKETTTDETQTTIRTSSTENIDRETSEVDVSIKETGEIHMEITKAVEPSENGHNAQNGGSGEESIEEIALSTDEQILKMKTEKTFLRQESEWIKTREKVCRFQSSFQHELRFMFSCRRSRKSSRRSLRVSRGELRRRRTTDLEHRRSVRRFCQAEGNGGMRRTRIMRISSPKSSARKPS